MNNQMYPCLWFDGQARAAADFYCSVFPQSKVVSENPVVTMWQLYGQPFMGLNGGPMFSHTPSLSLYVTCDSKEEVDQIWTKLSVQAKKILIPLGTYPWCEYYTFFQDKFGVAWQIFKGKYSDVNQKIVPCFLFTDNKFGKAHEAVQYYTSIFPNTEVLSRLFYDKNEMPQSNIVKHAQFKLDGNVYMAMDGPGTHEYTFNEAFSFVVNCNTQEEIDRYWNALIKDGGQESMCGWCKDKFGVSWQIVPAVLGKLMSDPDRSQRVMAAFMKMKKFEIDLLLKA